MKETGMVRRLDDLGRLVIPKEIRKMYKMKEGDSIEIYIRDGNITIRKFDETSAFYDQIEKMCEMLEHKYKNPVFFTSEEYRHHKQLDIEEKILEKASVHRMSMFENSKVYEKEEQRYSGVIAPIVHLGNYYGAFIMVFTTTRYQEEDLELLQAFSTLLASQQHN